MTENVAVVVVHIVHEQLTGEGLVVEIVGETAHEPVKVVTVGDVLACIVLLGVILAEIAVLEMFELFGAPVHEGIDGLHRVLLAHLPVFLDVVEVFLGDESLVVPLTGETFVVLCHQLRVGVSRNLVGISI